MFTIMRSDRILCSNYESGRFVAWKLIEDSVGETDSKVPYGPYLAPTLADAERRATKLNAIYDGKIKARALSEEELQQITFAKLKNVRYTAG